MCVRVPICKIICSTVAVRENHKINKIFKFGNGQFSREVAQKTQLKM